MTVCGAATINTLNVGANASVGGTLHVSGAVSMGSTLAVCGTTTMEGALALGSTVDSSATFTLNAMWRLAYDTATQALNLQKNTAGWTTVMYFNT